MGKLELVCQNDVLAREATPEENRVESRNPVEVGEIAEQIEEFSLAPSAVKQIREIERRGGKNETRKD
jgi:hypothetical protein